MLVNRVLSDIISGFEQQYALIDSQQCDIRPCRCCHIDSNVVCRLNGCFVKRHRHLKTDMEIMDKENILLWL